MALFFSVLWREDYANRGLGCPTWVDGWDVRKIGGGSNCRIWEMLRLLYHPNWSRLVLPNLAPTTYPHAKTTPWPTWLPKSSSNNVTLSLGLWVAALAAYYLLFNPAFFELMFNAPHDFSSSDLHHSQLFFNMNPHHELTSVSIGFKWETVPSFKF